MDSTVASSTRRSRSSRLRLEPSDSLPRPPLFDDNRVTRASPCDIHGPVTASAVKPFHGEHLSAYCPQEEPIRRQPRKQQPTPRNQRQQPKKHYVPEQDRDGLDAGEVVYADNVNENAINRTRRKLIRAKVAKDPKVPKKKAPAPTKKAEQPEKKRKKPASGREEQEPRRHCQQQHHTPGQTTTPDVTYFQTHLAALHQLPPLVSPPRDSEHMTSPSIYSGTPPSSGITTISSRRTSNPGRRSRRTTLEHLVQMMENLQLEDRDRLGIITYNYGQLTTYKPKKPRPKVLLDPESVRVFRLLMANQQEDAETTTNWEDVRQAYKEKALDFISRMHLVQGNRRFSRWKGSVVDSVIGTFLTQNVSDHLSSSAFMKLAARFPKKKKKGTGYIVEECDEEIPEVRANKVRRALFVDKPADESSSSCMTDVTPDSPPSTQTQPRTEEQTTSVSSPTGDSECMLGNQIVVQGEAAFADVPSTQESSGCIDSFRQESINFSTQADNATANSSCTACVLQVDNVLPNDQNKCTIEKQQTVATKTMKQYARRSRKSQSTNIQQTAATGGNGAASLEQSIPQRVVENAPLKQKKKRNLKVGQTGEFGEDNDDELDYSTPVKGGGPERGILEQKLGSKRKNYRCPQYICTKVNATKSPDPPDTVDWDEVRMTELEELCNTIRERGMNNVLGGRIKALLNKLHEVHGRIDLEWLRDVSPPLAKEILLSIHGIGIKSVECIRLLTLEHSAFPVDVNVGRILVRLGWVPLEPLPHEVQLHLLESYPVQETIQQYIWPRLCTLDQQTLYELHYQMITFGKVFCTKKRPNCNACPMRSDCKHFASAYGSAMRLPAPPDKAKEPALALLAGENREGAGSNVQVCSISNTIREIERELAESGTSAFRSIDLNVAPCEPIIEEPEEPRLPEPAFKVDEAMTYTYEEDPDMEDSCGSSNGVTLHLNLIPNDEEVYVPPTSSRGDVTCMEIVRLPLYVPMPKLKNMYRLRTVHHVYELPDNHELLRQLDVRELDDPCYYLLVIWAPGEEGDGVDSNKYVKGSLLIPCRTAMRGSFPLNGTYFQVNEVFADHETSIRPLNVDRLLLWNLARRSVYFGSSVSNIFKGMTTEEIQHCFWRGYVCVRAFDRVLRKPQPLATRLHFLASKKGKKGKEMEEEEG